jgi:hypothetical protein
VLSSDIAGGFVVPVERVARQFNQSKRPVTFKMKSMKAIWFVEAWKRCSGSGELQINCSTR